MKTNVFLGIVAAVLAVPTTWTIMRERGSFTRYEDVPRLFEGFTPEKVAAIQITKVERDENGDVLENDKGEPQKASLTIAKDQNGDWVMSGNSPLRGAPVRKDAVVTAILQHVEAIRRDEEALIEVDASDELLAEYDLTEDTGVLIQCYGQNVAAGPTVELIKGSSARNADAGKDSLRGHFVRRKDRKDIVLYEQDYWILQLEPQNWFERGLMPGGAAGQAVRFRLRNAFGEVEFVKDKPTDVEWKAKTAPDGTGAPRQGDLNSLVGRAAGAAAADFQRAIPASGPQRSGYLKQFGMGADALEAEIELEDGNEFTLLIGDKLDDKNEYHAVCSNRDFLITVPDHLRSALEVDIMDLFDPAAPNSGGGDKEQAGDDNDGDDGGK